MSETTICGGCNCRVSIKLQHPDDHNCVLIADLKKSMNLSLSEIQNDYERRIKNLDKKLRDTDHVGNCQAETISILCRKVNKLEQELSNCIDVKLLYSDRQARETWQTGCEVMINTLQQRLSDLDFMFKQAFICVDNSHTADASRYLGTVSIPELNKMAMGELKVHHPSRKHLEGKLREKNELIKEHKAQIESLEKLLDQAVSNHQSAVKRISHLGNALDCLQKENNELTFKLQHYQCKKVCCLPRDGRYVNDLHTR